MSLFRDRSFDFLGGGVGVQGAGFFPQDFLPIEKQRFFFLTVRMPKYIYIYFFFFQDKAKTKNIFFFFLNNIYARNLFF